VKLSYLYNIRLCLSTCTWLLLEWLSTPPLWHCTSHWCRKLIFFIKHDFVFKYYAFLYICTLLNLFTLNMIKFFMLFIYTNLSTVFCNFIKFWTWAFQLVSCFWGAFGFRKIVKNHNCFISLGALLFTIKSLFVHVVHVKCHTALCVITAHFIQQICW